MTLKHKRETMKTTLRITMILFVFVKIVNTMAFGQSYHWDWARAINCRTTAIVNSVAADKSGNTYITGGFSDTLTIGGLKLFSKGHSDIFLAKIDTDGNPAWLRQAGGSESDEAYGIALDNLNNVYITGYVSGDADFSGLALKTKGARDFFLAKYDNEGNLLWVKKQEGANDDYGKSVCADQQGNVYVSGVFKGPLVLGGQTVKPRGKLNVFIYKYSGKGDFCWGRIGEGEGSNQVAEINVDRLCNVYVGGTFEGKAEFDKNFITSTNTKDVFLVKYNTEGVIQWLKKGGSAIGENNLSAIAVDSAENIFVTGSFAGIAWFDKKQMKSKGSDDLFLVKYSKEGNVLWAVQSGGKGNEHAQSMEVDSKGDILVAGNFTASFTFGPSDISSTGDWDIFILKYSPDGKMLGGAQIGGNGYDKAMGIALSGQGNIFLAGYFGDEIKVGNTLLKSPGKKGCSFIASLKDL